MRLKRPQRATDFLVQSELRFAQATRDLYQRARYHRQVTTRCARYPRGMSVK
jgi:hypothetical protein